MADGFPRIVTIYGTGLMGSSLALALKKSVPGVRVFGIDSPEILARARQIGAIDEGESGASDLIVLATPVSEILRLLERIPESSGVLLDLGSTKADICRKAVTRNLRFVGGHPLTGSERSGPEAASAEIFREAPFFLCPIASTPDDLVSKISGLVKAIDAQPIVMDPATHDQIVSRLSHLPQLLSTLLAEQTADLKELAGPGWKSLTRLAASPFHVWRDILATSGPLPHELRAFISRLQALAEALEAGDMDQIEGVFQRANRAISLHEN